MINKLIFSLLNVFILLYLLCLPSLAQERDIKDIVSNFVDLTSISKEYKVYQAVSDLKSFYKIVFINTKNQQRMSISSLKKNRALSNGELENFLKNTLTNIELKDQTGFENKNISIRSFMIDRQHVPYFIMDQYGDNQLIDKAMIGVIPNYNGYSLIIQSFSDPKNFNQSMAEDFFKNIKINTRNMY